MPGPPTAPPSVGLVSFDIDGTIAIGHGWARVARARGIVAAFEEAQAVFASGKVGEDEHLRTLLNFAQGMPLDRFRRLLEGTPRLPHLSSLVRSLRNRGVLVAMLTHNPLYVCDWYARRYGFDLYAGVEQRVRGGRIAGVGAVHVDKRAGLALLARATGVPPSRIAHLGDGRADAAVFPYVGTAIAVNSRLPEVRNAADLSVNTRDARHLLPLLLEPVRSRPRPLPHPALPSGSFRCRWTSSRSFPERVRPGASAA